MIEYPKWRYWLVALVMGLAVLYATPNLFPQDFAVQVGGIKGALVDEAMQKKVEEALAGAQIAVKRIDRDPTRMLVRLNSSEDQAKALSVIAGQVDENNYNTALNLASTVPDWLRKLGGKPVTLGLDLQGGVHFLLEVDQEAAQQKIQERSRQSIYTTLQSRDIAYRGVDLEGGVLTVRLDQDSDRAAAHAALIEAFTDFDIEDVASDPKQIRLSFRPEALNQNASSVIEQNTSTLRNRINDMGVGEPVIQRQGQNRIVVQLPGVQDTAAAKRRISATATLEYRASIGTTADAAAAKLSGRVPPEAILLEMGDGTPVLLSKEIIASGDQLISATDGTDPKTGTPAVSVRLNSAGGDRMLEFTSRNVGKPMGVVYVERVPVVRVIDGVERHETEDRKRVINVATIQSTFGDQFQTTGLDSREEAKELATFLRGGALAAPLSIVEERVVGPSLGRDNIIAGRNSVLLGLAGIFIFMVIYYKTFGVISMIGLTGNLILLLAVLSLINATMTMPGIAGIALTLGMAIDANVLVNERIREELRSGMTPLASIRAGYEKAWATIFDSNMTTLIAGVALFALGSGPIRGFALVLCIGILTTMFTAITVTYAVVGLMYGGKKKLTRVSV